MLLEKEKNPNFEKYLILFVDEIKKNDIWKKFEKDNEELIKIKNTKVSDLIELIDYFKQKKNKKKQKNNQKINIFDNKQIECPLKKYCLLKKEKSKNRLRK